MKSKILFLVSEDWYFWSHRLAIAQAALENGLDVVVATRINQHADEIEKAGFKLVPINMLRGSMNVLHDLVTFFCLVKTYKLEKPDLVHHVALKPIIYGSWAARCAGVPWVVNAFAGLGNVFVARDFKGHILRKFISIALKSALSRKNIRVIFQNEDDLNLFLAKRLVSDDRAFLIKGSGVDTELFYPGQVKKGLPIVVLASRMLWTKGVGDFVEVARILKKRGIKARMVLLGSPDDMNPSSINVWQLQQWNDEGIVEWWGWSEEIPSILQQSSVAVLPSSYGEGVPKFLIEAASAGLPIVTYDVPGCREIVRDGENGLLVPLQNIQLLARAIENLVENPDMRKKMGERSREIAKDEFSQEHIIQETLALYKELLGVKWNYRRAELA